MLERPPNASPNHQRRRGARVVDSEAIRAKLADGADGARPEGPQMAAQREGCGEAPRREAGAIGLVIPNG
jgi:hypothetical protein